MDADEVGEILDFGLAVAGEQHDAVDAMARAEVVDEGDAFAARRVAETVGGGVTIVDEDHAFEAAGGGRKLGGCGRLLDGELLAAGEADLVAADGAAESLARLLADFGGVLKGDFLDAAGADDGFGERMLRVLFETGDEREDVGRVEVRAR